MEAITFSFNDIDFLIDVYKSAGVNRELAVV